MDKLTENKKDLMPLSEAAEITGQAPEHLSLLCRKKKLKAEKIGRNWYTKKEWINQFLNVTNGIKETEQAKPSGNPAAEDKFVFPDRLTRKISQIYAQAEANEARYKEFMASEREAGGDAEDAEDEKEKLKRELGLVRERKIILPETEKKSFGGLRIFAVMATVIVLVPFIFSGVRVVMDVIGYKNQGSENDSLALIYATDENLETKIFNENSDGGRVAGEQAIQAGEGVLASANYRINNINVGGNVLILSDDSNKTLQIYDIKSASFADNKKNETSLIVSWKTNKLALSELEYAKNGGQNPVALEEVSYGFNHSAVIVGLDPGSPYVFHIKSKDRWANEIDSDFFGVYTASKPISVFDLISNATGEVFGWAIKK